MSRPEVEDTALLSPFAWLTEVVEGATSWLPDGIEPYVQVLVYLGILGALSVVPLVAWLLWAARPRRAS
jgi:hypothetical protein